MDQTRRRFLKGIGAVGTTAALGGLSTAVSGRQREGGRIRLGTFRNLVPQQLNPFFTSRTTEDEFLRFVYDPPVIFSPETGDPIPWAFDSVELREENIGTDEPTVVGTVRPGQTFHDGVSLTAEDVVFTYETILKNDLDEQAGLPNLSALAGVERSGDRTVEFFLDEPLATFRDNILGVQIVPKHRWTEFDPTSTDPVEDGLVGSGPWEVKTLDIADTANETQIVLTANDDYSVGEAYDVEGPILDRIDVELFGANRDGLLAAANAIENRELDIASVTAPPKAKQFLADPCFDIAQGSPDGFIPVPYNTLRRPLDDRAFRRALSTAFDEQQLVEDVFLGLGEAGDYAAPPSFEDIRPQTPEEADQFAYPRASDGSLDVEAIRDLLRNADSDREYTFGPVVNDDLVTGDAELRIDGQPLTEFHTDSDGNPGQGPLEYLDFNNRLGSAGQDWIAELNEVGIPAVRDTSVSFGDVIERGLFNAQFDFLQVEFNGVRRSYNFVSQFLASDGGLNISRYDGADDLLAKQETILDDDRREAVLREALQRAYDDQPVLISGYSDENAPFYRGFTGVVPRTGNILNKFTAISLQRAPAVSINVKPGDDGTAPINPDSGGVTPVAVLGSENFDVRSIDPSTVRCGGAETVDACEGVGPVGEGEFTDVTGDGTTDRVFRFPTGELG
ncbi:MAG: ABC transporter substrate-binding protein, partial [Halobaculum sp.]